MYIISYDADDIDLPRRQRSKQFVGKLQIIKNNTSYIGYRQSASDDRKNPTVAILYDHERYGTTDRKMEVAIPISIMEHELCTRAKHNVHVNVDTNNTNHNGESFPNFYNLYMKIRHEGQENYMNNDKILCLTQENDCSIAMSADSSVGTYFADVATKVSCKNFLLGYKKPSRKWVVDKIVDGTKTNTNTNDTTNININTNITSIFNMSNITQTESTSSTTIDSDYIRFGKMSSDVYCCKILSDKIDVVTAFMIILSRFDTLQQF